MTLARDALDAIALLTAVHSGDPEAVETALETGDHRSTVLLLADVVVDMMREEHRSGREPVADRLRHVGLMFAEEAAAE